MVDSEKVSEEPHEVRTAAKAMQVPKWVVLLAKDMTGSEDRKTLYEWIVANRGKYFTYQ